MTYTKIRQQTAAMMGDAPACVACKAPVKRATLADFGGRCFGCFAAYRREKAPAPPRSKAAERIRAEIAAMGRRVPA